MPPRWASRTLLYTSETYCRLSVFLIAVACKDFPTAPSLAAYSCSPRAETVISSLRSLSAYHRLAFPGLYSSILSVANMLMSVFTGVDSSLQFIAVPSTKEALLARNWKRAEQGYSFAFQLKNLQTSRWSARIFQPKANSPFLPPHARLSTSKQNFDSR